MPNGTELSLRHSFAFAIHRPGWVNYIADQGVDLTFRCIKSSSELRIVHPPNRGLRAIARLSQFRLIRVLEAGLLLLSTSQDTRGEDCGSLIGQGKQLLDEQKTAAAQAAFLSAARNCPDLAEAYKFLGITFDQQQRFADAQSAFEKAITLDPKDPGTHNDLAVSYFRSGNAAAGAKELEITLRLNPSDVSANGNLAAYYLSQKEYQSAANHLLAAHADKSSDPLLLLELTQAYFGAGKHAAAVATAAKLSHLAGANPQMRFSLGLLLAQNGEYKSALHEFSEIPEPSRDAALYVNLGNVNSKLGRFAEAREAFSKALLLDPSNPEACLQMGLNSLQIGNLNEALDWLDKAHERAPQRSDAIQALAEALIDAQQFDRARDLLMAAQTQTPREPLILQGLGDLHSSQHEDQAALAAYRECLEIDPHRVESRLALARTLGRVNRIPEAKAEYAKVLEADPQNSSAHAGLGHLALESGALALAATELASALRLNPSNLQANEDLARVFMRQGKFDDARGVCEKLIALRPDNPGYHYELGQAFLKLDRKDQAQREFARSQELKAGAAQRVR
jgi:tetratricopeptide (TPR) repeat protein